MVKPALSAKQRANAAGGLPGVREDGGRRKINRGTWEARPGAAACGRRRGQRLRGINNWQAARSGVGGVRSSAEAESCRWSEGTLPESCDGRRTMCRLEFSTTDYHASLEECH